MAAQGMPESELDDDYEDDDQDDDDFYDINEEDSENDQSEEAGDGLDEIDAEDIDVDEAMQPGSLEGDSGATFFLETEDADGNVVGNHVHHMSLRELQQLLTYGMASFEQDEPTSDESDDNASSSLSRWRFDRSSDTPLDLWEPVTRPVRAGQELLYSGDFGVVRDLLTQPWTAKYGGIASQIARRKTLARPSLKFQLAYPLLPNSRGVLVAQYPAPCYSGQYSADSSFFYTCTRDMRVHVYDTTIAPRTRPETVWDQSYFGGRDDDNMEQVTSLNLIQTVEARGGQWTITDVNLSPDNQWIVYSSISPYVGLSPVRRIEDDSEPSANQVTLDFSANSGDHAGIWSLRFSGDSREIIAGAHYGHIYVYDVEAQRRVLSVPAHDDDVNSVTFADSASSNVFVSGSDDAMLKVWDRRSLVRGKPAGCLPGHTEGITYISPKGDGRYCISNSKDQSVRLWDLRNLRSVQDVERWATLDCGLNGWDYRYMPYRRPRYYAHPEDCSVMTYRGHSVLRTLIRCYFSPRETTGQQYIYSGSADGRIHIWSLDGQVAQVIDRNQVHPMHTSDGYSCDPTAPEDLLPAPQQARRNRSTSRLGRIRRPTNREQCIVRDVSWHSDEPTLMSTAWDSDGQTGSVAQHQWKPTSVILWKNHFVQMLNPRGGIQCLDVAGGTGDIALRLLDHARTQHLDRETKVTVLDINPQMLLEGQKRLKNTIYWNTPQIKFQLGNAEALDKVMEVPERRNPPASTLKNPILPPLTSEPIASESMDLYTIAFGIRNCTHIDEVIREAYRVLKPGGIFACLEFGKVSVPLLAQLYKQYSFSVIPPLGQLLVGDRDSYQYLVESIERFPTQARFAEMVAEAGFLSPGSVEAQSMGLPRLSGPNGSYEDLSLGIATIWTGIKPFA
ncbi:hypothetical protein MPSI1_000993 [Malassezia psittaci]|uniref:2-methoxy-6-polyprenyl-1,4-benzoquinol methylase, mitochondrial n=1 Tax=Malassezia psittaci TaxID=1821823 RepID=A0AAF0F3N9_9BASI|nr:hypothetical protein MPSI1_000993 [Malassezia psittaci]